MITILQKVVRKIGQSYAKKFGFLEVGVRQNDLAFEVRDYLKTHPKASLVNLGCGLDNTGRHCDNGTCKIYNLDFPDVIAVRNELFARRRARAKNIPCDLNNTEWFEKNRRVGRRGVFASGVFYYFSE
ncbi:MAG: class I SAM-dependent methyltransferase [Clostridiales bacterium]|nr:MAG: class I SAM-dependent methyltransferase [Clostridiales bacterium]